MPTYLLMDVERGKWYWRVGMVRALSVPICFPSYSNTLHPPPLYQPSSVTPVYTKTVRGLCIVLFRCMACVVFNTVLLLSKSNCYCAYHTVTAHTVLLLSTPYCNTFFSILMLRGPIQLLHTLPLHSPYCYYAYVHVLDQEELDVTMSSSAS